MGKVLEKKKKKKGRPSLLDLQKRTLKEQEEQQKQLQIQQKQKRPNLSPFNSNPNYHSATPVRRSTRRNPNPDSLSPENALEDTEDEDELSGKRREKKLMLVLRLPNQKSSLNSASLNSCGSDSNADDDDLASNNKKRKINAIGDGSALADPEKGEKSISGTNPSNTLQDGGSQLDSGPSTPLPDKKLLLFILDRLQKKDTYGVFSEPVDPNELPDYHEVIEHPMDFRTVRKKLTSGVYASLEQFEKDVFLICSNAMQYNAPDTIYFRQARSIHELAKKNFENLRQDSDDNETEPKVVRRGRPPTKNLKKPLGRPSLERTVPEFSSSATLATVAEKNNWSNYDLRRGLQNSDKSSLPDSSGRLPSSRNSDVYMSWLAENKLERGDECAGSISKGTSVKHWKKQIVFDDKRRDTYKQFHASAVGGEPSVLHTFDGERKLLMPVGIQSEYGYARSLSRFAANLGPMAWKIASKKIERSLPSGVNFGPGWVVENDIIPQRPLILPSEPGQVSPLQPFLSLEKSSSVPSCTSESEGVKLPENPEGNNLSEKHVSSTHTPSDDTHISKTLHKSNPTSSSPFISNQSPEPSMRKSEAMDPCPSFNILDSSINAIRTKPRQIHRVLMAHPGMNGCNGTYGFNFPRVTPQMGKLVGSARPSGFNTPSQMLNSTSRIDTNLVSKDPNFEKSSTTNAEGSLLSSGNEASGLHSQQSWQGSQPDTTALIPQNKIESVPPDLNVRFQSLGSPSSGRVESGQPDLALQL